MLRATHLDSTIGIGIFLVHGGVAYAHLAAYSKAGYSLRASSAMYWSSIELLTGTVGWIDWGANAGTVGDTSDGLSQFKRGWSTGMRTAYLCGRIFDRQKYSEIVTLKGVPANNYFPAYRYGEYK